MHLIFVHMKISLKLKLYYSAYVITFECLMLRHRFEVQSGVTTPRAIDKNTIYNIDEYFMN